MSPLSLIRTNAATWCLGVREYAQKLRHYLPQMDDAGVEVVGVSLGTVDAARYFCSETGFPLDNMFMVSPYPVLSGGNLRGHLK